MSCLKTLTLSISTVDSPMDAAIYHPSRQTLFSVRGGYVFETSLAGVQISVSKFVNPCFSKSCIAYDSVHDKLWIGTMGDWSAGRTGDPGSPSVPSLTNAGLYRINPASLALEQAYYPGNSALGGMFFNGAAWMYQMPNPGVRNPPHMAASESGYYDIIFAAGKLWASLYVNDGIANFFGCITAYDPTNIAGSNFLLEWSNGPIIQCAFEQSNSPNRVWYNSDDDLFVAGFPGAMNVDWTAPGDGNPSWSNFDSPYPPAVAGGASGAICYSPVGGGAVYLIQLTGSALVKYNINGTINSTPTLAGVSNGGQCMRIRFNSNDNHIYIPLPALNQVAVYDPSTDTVSHIYSGLDAPHDCVFSPTKKFAVQWGSAGIKELL